MLSYGLLSLLFAALAVAHAINQRDDSSLTDGAKKALQSAGIDLAKQYVKPRQKVEELLAIGDSYTAGIGSNGLNEKFPDTLECSRYKSAWPVQLSEKDDWNQMNDNTKPRLTFGACSGAVMQDLRDTQLKQGDPVNGDHTPIGHPQLAVLTITGNDVLFAKAINDCIFRIGWRLKSCDQRLAEIDGILSNPAFKQDILNTYALIIAAGREAGKDGQGANPVESFQAFVGGYVGLFNHDDTGCDDVYWNVLRWGISYKQFLKRDLRKRINDRVDTLNGIIQSAAKELEQFGVIYVEGYNDSFSKRRFCEELPHWAHESLYQDRNAETAFWSYRSKWGKQDEGEGFPIKDSKEGDNYDIEELAQQLEEVLVPDPKARQRINNETTPWDVNPNLLEYDDIFAAIHDFAKNDSTAQGMDDDLDRMFHPKGSAYTYFADKWMETIAANRDKPGQDQPPPATPPPGPTKALGIVADFLAAPASLQEIPDYNKIHWQFFATDYGKTVDCRTDFVYQYDQTIDRSKSDMTWYPGGTFDLNLFGEACQYKNEGDNEGALFCGDKHIDCKDDPADKNPSDPHANKGNYACGEYTRQPVFTCPY